MPTHSDCLNPFNFMRNLNQMTILLPCFILAGVFSSHADDAKIRLLTTGSEIRVQVLGNQKDEWRFQTSEDLLKWSTAPALGSVFSGRTSPQSAGLNTADTAYRFIRAVRTEGLFDPNLLRTVSLTFTNPNWATLLADARLANSNVPCLLSLDNGVTVANVGARYKGLSSYTMGGDKKSINLDVNWADSEARVMGYRAINLNNASGDETMMREPIYFNILREYVPGPRAALARLIINGEYWGVYSMVDQINNELIDDWFPSHSGDRWRSPNLPGGVGGDTGSLTWPTNGIPTEWPTNEIPGVIVTNEVPGEFPTNGIGGGAGLGSGDSAFGYLGASVSSYTNNYELKSHNSTNAWERLVHAIDVLNNTPAGQLRDKVEEVFAVDRWLWFLAIENIFVDGDGYLSKGADYCFYYEPESGRIHPVEYDGNECLPVGGADRGTNAVVVDGPSIGITDDLDFVSSHTNSPVAGGTNRPLLSKLLSIPELRQRYLAHMRTVLDERFNPTCLKPVIDHFHLLTVADIVTDRKKEFTMLDYTNALVALKTFVTNRYEFLTNHAELRPQPPKIVAVHVPSPLPGPADVPFITAQVEPNGSDGIDSVWLYWRDKPYGRFAVAQMFDDGAHHDGAANDGWFGASTTNYPAGNKIHYYIEARSANASKAGAFSPARAEQDTYSYRVVLAPALTSQVVINELMADNAKTIADPQGGFDDWIELRNLSAEAVDLTGHYLTDDQNTPRKWPFPAGTAIPAGGYLLVWADKDGAATLGLHANFKLDQAGEQVLLIDTDANLNRVLDSVTFGPQTMDYSYGRSPANREMWQIMEPTPGLPNK